MGMKVTRHNGRAGKFGTYNIKHNDRNFDDVKKDADKRITIIIAHGELPEGLINVDING